MESYKHRFAKELVREWLVKGNLITHQGELRFVEEGACNREALFLSLCPPPNPDHDSTEFALYCRKHGIHQLFDIACVKNTRVIAAVEIVHKHPCSAGKILACHKLGVEVLEVEAEWVLTRTGIPEGFKHIGHHHSGQSIFKLL